MILESTASPDSPSAQPDPAGAERALHLLRDYFQSMADRGETRLPLSEPARQALRNIVMSRKVSTPRQTAAALPSAPAAARRTVSPPPDSLPPPAPAPAAAAPPARIRPPALPLEERVRKLAVLKSAAAMHEPAFKLGTLRDTMVFAVGDPMARIMFVGEAPGSEEEEKGEPFVGPAGATLTKMITAMGLQRSEVYISNICKFRPKMPGQTTNNRKPDPDEMAACVTFIQQEIDIVQPDVIVALGATSAEGLLGLTTVAVGRVRAKFHDYQGTPVMITYHPSYLLHNPAMSERRKVWEDLLKVMEKLNLPISEKQRGFFLPKERGS